ncbi:leucine-rich repeat protein [Treponema sp. OMZ 840]|uniref:leucine-rich repeat protein n=1 Tax=Treponema sp. OMZ 840 TaxID=244313 RepID=UPI003D925A4B
MTQVKFPASLTAIRETAFIGCMGLTELNLPVKLTTVENYAFYGCKNSIPGMGYNASISSTDKPDIVQISLIG